MIACAQLREAGIADVPVLAVLHAGCFEDCWSAQSMLEVLSSPGVRAWIAFAAPTDASAGAEVTPAGFAIARVAADEAELLSIGVLEGFRRQGIATMLLSQVTRHVTASGARRLFLEVAEDNLPAQALYAAHDFTMVGKRPDYYRTRNGGSVTALTLRRLLPPLQHLR
ncbi:MAG TPA: GNAT family N-acetyltransferase [Alphaproteobacteria bacterium]